MSRAQRLLDLIQVLRRHRHPVSGATLAEATGVSLRTLYRDIELLKAEGAHIDGEAGVGYVLRPGFMLPPLMFSEEEIEALVLGSRWVHQRADRALADAAANVLAKIGAVLPKDLRDTLDESGLLIGPGDPIAAGDAQLPKIRQAIRTERKIGLSYRDNNGADSKRIDLAVRLELLREGAGGRGVVRTARGLPPLPHRPHRRAEHDREALSAPPPGDAEGMARARADQGRQR